MMNREWIAFTCAVVCTVAIPFVVNALACKLGRTLGEECQTRAFLYLSVDVVLLVMIFCFWLLG